MADHRFFKAPEAITLKDIVTLTGATPAVADGNAVDQDRIFLGIAPLDRAEETDISFLDNVKYVHQFTQSKAGACFVRPKFVSQGPKGMVLLITDEPYFAYAQTARRMYPENPVISGISPLAVIAPDAVIGNNVRIDSGAVIGSGAQIGDGCWIGANTVIDEHVHIGKQSRIGAICTLSHCLIGNDVILHRGVHIGQDGFGFAPSSRGIVKVPQIGRVLIGDDVEIGSGTCIDRGAGPDTTIGKGSKIDNLVQIGHNCQIGQYVFIAAQTGLAGSTHIGDGVMIGGQAGFSGHVHVGAGAKIAAQSGVMTDVPAGSTFGGGPAMPAREWHRQTLAVAKLAKAGKHPED